MTSSTVTPGGDRAGQSAEDDVSWSRVEDGFYVGSNRGNFVGYIDRLPNEGFAAFDAFSRNVGTYPDQIAAMTAVASLPTPDQETRRDEGQ